MPPPLPLCRHRGEEVSAGVHRCHSAKLVGLKLVDGEMCGSCFCRDHEPVPSLTAAAPPWLPCAHRGAGPLQGPAGEEAVYACSHPRHGQTTEAGCRSCPDYLFPLLTERTPVAIVQRLLALPPRPQPDGWAWWPNVQEAHRRAADDFLARPRPYPGSYTGRGVVLVGGGKYFTSAYVAVRVLRHVGCSLPVELWHLDGEIDATMRRLLEPQGVRCVNADAVVRQHPFRFLEGHWWKGWQLKPYAIVHSSFREVLLLDADCYPVRDPEPLFDWPAYRRLGAVFWPDPDAMQDFLVPRWPVFGLAPPAHWPTESGQLLVDKELCWGPLNLALHYNAHADFTYQIIYGDKDTFPIAWARLGQAYARMWPRCDWDTHTIIQHDDRGRPLFLHRTRDKWRLAGGSFDSTYQLFPANLYNPGLPHEDFCFACLDDLRQVWQPNPTPLPAAAL